MGKVAPVWQKGRGTRLRLKGAVKKIVRKAFPGTYARQIMGEERRQAPYDAGARARAARWGDRRRRQKGIGRG